jgi:hypothetical protein
MRNRVFFFAGLVLLLGAGVAGAANTTGTLIGNVTDGQGAPLPGVTVTVSSPAQIGGEKSVTTGADGTFNFPELAPGTYSARIELEGFATQEVKEIQVRLDRTAKIIVELPQAELTEQITVTAEVPLLDTTQTSIAQTYSQDYLENVPVGSDGRDYLAIIGQAAGAVGTGNPNVFGSLSNENAYYIDGVDTTDPVTATFGTNFNYDAIQEISYNTAGYEAEHGRAIGGVVNLITKSGGNEFSGTLDIRYQTNDFQKSGDFFDADQQDSEFIKPAVTVGGPVMRDRIWFFGSYEDISSKSTPFMTTDVRDFQGENYLGKLTWQAAESWRVVGKYSADPAVIEGSNADPTVETAALSTQEQGGTIYQGDVSGVLSTELIWDLGVGFNRQDLDVFPQSGDFNTPGHTDFDTGEAYINYTNAQFSNRDRDDYRTSLTYLVDELAGSHEFKVGLEHSETAFGTSNNTVSGFSFQDRVFQGVPRQPFILLVNPIAPASDFDGSLNSAYVQDAWRVLPELTLKLGVRYDQVDFTNDIGTEIADMNKIQPRLGFAYDIGGNAKTVVRGSWGRFMHPNALTLPFIARVANTPTDRYLSCSRFIGATSLQECIDAFGAENVISDPVGLDPTGWFFNTRFSSSPSTIQEGLEPTYADTWIVGVQHQLGASTTIDLSYIEKDTKDIFEDTCNGNIDNPSPTAACDFYTVGNLEGLRRNYEGIVLQVNTRAATWLTLRASYTYSESQGNIGNTQNAGVDFDIFPEHFVNRYGYLSDHRRHRAKVNGFARLPLDFGIAFEGFYGSPSVYTPVQAAPSYGDEFVEPRGSREVDDGYFLNLELTKGFQIGPVRTELVGSVFNVFDDEQVTSRCNRVAGCGGGINFNDPDEYTDPLRYELGFRLEF